MHHGRADNALTLAHSPSMSRSGVGSYASLLPPSWKSQVTEWLAEDTPSFDYAGFVVGDTEREAYLFGKSDKLEAKVLAGSPFFEEIFKQVGCT
jgi:nicotinate-nucleotide pyrophosphorylase (carboxylating)